MVKLDLNGGLVEYSICVFIGIIAIKAAQLIYGALSTYAIGPMLYKVDFKSKGKWALVTGCTDGIGKEYARQLASRGLDIILVSRTMEKLTATAQEIEKEFQVATKVIQADFTAGEEVYDTIAEAIAGLEIGTLVNNVGMSYPYPEYFLDLPEWDKTVSSLLKANIVSTTRMTRMVLPSMVQRGKGVLINIGSASSVIPSPLLTVYAATKAYVDKFSEGIDMEYSKHGIIVQSILPGFVCTNMSGIRKKSLFAPSAKRFVQEALNLVGTASRTPGYAPHAAFVNVLNCIKDCSYGAAVWLVTRSMETSRSRVIKKYKKQ